MKVIWKYELKVADEQTVEMPAGAKCLAVGYQGLTLCLWASVDPKARIVEHSIIIRGTGQPFCYDDKKHIGTVFYPASNLVWHVYDGGESK